MKVKELIEKLSEFNPEADIIIDNLNDKTKVDISWGLGNSGDGEDISKKESTHIILDIVKDNEEGTNNKQEPWAPISISREGVDRESKRVAMKAAKWKLGLW